MRGPLARAFLMAALAVAAATGASADDPARRACYVDAKRLCPDAVRALSRKRAELCLAAKIEQTSPGCHATILRVRAERQAKTQKTQKTR